jgi:NitT/TauT family transport system ATP-binding protein
MSKLRISNVVKVFENSKRGDIAALDNLSFSVEEGEFFCIVGPSGCGKSTLLQMIIGLESPTSGEVLIDETPIHGPRLDCGVVFQEYALFPWKTVQENIEFGPKMRRVVKQERRGIARKYIELTGLQGFEAYYPHEISGGMKQRVAIARALANEPDVFLMDEPFAAVDALLREILQQEILRIWEQTKKTIVFITHQIEEAVFLADRVLIMSARPGRVKEIIEVNLPRPRQQEIRVSPQFQQITSRIRQKVWGEVT